MYRVIIITTLILFVAVEAFLLYEIEEHYWVIPAFIMFNIAVVFLLTRYIIIRAFVFSFGQQWIVNREVSDLNGKYCTQYGVLFKRVRNGITDNMLTSEYNEVDYTDYRR